MIIPDDRYVEANEIRLHYLVWRSATEGHAPSFRPIVLLHATGFLARLWQPIAEALAGHFDVYAYDTRGHGDSDKPEAGVRSQEPGVGSQEPVDGEGPYHWQNLVADLRGFCDALGLRSVPIA